jgi:hypothetical protein
MLILIQIHVRIHNAAFKNTCNVHFRKLARRATMTAAQATQSGELPSMNINRDCPLLKLDLNFIFFSFGKLLFLQIL